LLLKSTSRNEKINHKGATIIFSTHYSELLDEFQRTDDIYIVRNKNGINVEKLSKILNRNDIKKSEAYQSGYLQGTAPAYEAYIDFKNAIASSRIDEV
jgi:ABC-type multidrug transport system ATPase subunit